MVNPATIIKAVTKLVNNSGNFVKEPNNRGAKKKLSEEIENEICSPEKLKEHKFLSLKERCVQIRADYGISIVVSTLKVYYKRNNIRFR